MTTTKHDDICDRCHHRRGDHPDGVGRRGRCSHVSRTVDHEDVHCACVSFVEPALPAASMPREQTSLGHRPSGPWAFDESVTNVFDDMLKRSIPQHDEMRAIVVELTSALAMPRSSVIDLGCSRGEALHRAREALRTQQAMRDVSYLGAEISPPMLAAARDRFAGADDVRIIEHDLRHGCPVAQRDPSVVMSVLTLQFTPIEHRQHIVASVHDYLARRGGAFILVEKILGATARIDRMLVDTYHDRKRANGYSDDEVARKRHSLEGVLVPVTARWNEDLLRSAGFVDVDCVWRSLNFAAWVAIARSW